MLKIDLLLILRKGRSLCCKPTRRPRFFYVKKNRPWLKSIYFYNPSSVIHLEYCIEKCFLFLSDYDLRKHIHMLMQQINNTHDSAELLTFLKLSSNHSKTIFSICSLSFLTNHHIKGLMLEWMTTNLSLIYLPKAEIRRRRKYRECIESRGTHFLSET